MRILVIEGLRNWWIQRGVTRIPPPLFWKLSNNPNTDGKEIKKNNERDFNNFYIRVTNILWIYTFELTCKLFKHFISRFGKLPDPHLGWDPKNCDICVCVGLNVFAVCKKCWVDNRLSYLGRIFECHMKMIDWLIMECFTPYR